MNGFKMNPKNTNAFARVGLIVGRSHHKASDETIISSTTKYDTVNLTYGDLRELLSLAYDAGDRLQRISSWHSRESGLGGLVGIYCIECGHTWPCDTNRMAEGTYSDDE